MNFNEVVQQDNEEPFLKLSVRQRIGTDESAADTLIEIRRDIKEQIASLKTSGGLLRLENERNVGKLEEVLENLRAKERIFKINYTSLEENLRDIKQRLDYSHSRNEKLKERGIELSNVLTKVENTLVVFTEELSQQESAEAQLHQKFSSFQILVPCRDLVSLKPVTDAATNGFDKKYQRLSSFEECLNKLKQKYKHIRNERQSVLRTLESSNVKKELRIRNARAQLNALRSLMNIDEQDAVKQRDFVTVKDFDDLLVCKQKIMRFMQKSKLEEERIQSECMKCLKTWKNTLEELHFEEKNSYLQIRTAQEEFVKCEVQFRAEIEKNQSEFKLLDDPVIDLKNHSESSQKLKLCSLKSNIIRVRDEIQTKRSAIKTNMLVTNDNHTIEHEIENIQLEKNLLRQKIKQNEILFQQFESYCESELLRTTETYRELRSNLVHARRDKCNLAAAHSQRCEELGVHISNTENIAHELHKQLTSADSKISETLKKLDYTTTKRYLQASNILEATSLIHFK